MKLLRAKDVAEKIGVHRTSVFRMAKELKAFPQPVRVSAKYTAWVEHEVDGWLEDKIKERNNESQ